MFSLQRLLGKDDVFCGLLEASAREALNSVTALKRILTDPEAAASLEDFATARRKDKEITNELEELLIRTFVTALEREDIERLADRLYKIPKTVEKFAERYLLAAPQVRDVDFSQQVNLMEQAVQTVLTMVQALHERDLAVLADLQNKLQAIESEADYVILEYTQRLYQPDVPPLKAIILKDLFELNERVVDRCRDVGSVITHIVHKNA